MLQKSVFGQGLTGTKLSVVMTDPYQNFIRPSTNYQITIDVIDHD